MRVHPAYPFPACTLGNRTRRSSNNAPLRPVILLSDSKIHPYGPPLPYALAGKSLFILRDYNHRQRKTVLKQQQQRAARRHIPVLVAGNGTLAFHARAEGVHLPEHLVRYAIRWRRKVSGWIITTACHSYPALVNAARFGAHFGILSPVFQTDSHKTTPPLGLLRTALIIRNSPIPTYVLGGVKNKNIRHLHLLKTLPQWAGVAGVRWR